MDELWHAHILDTAAYLKICDGEVVHHQRTGKNMATEQERTKRLLEVFFLQDEELKERSAEATADRPCKRRKTRPENDYDHEEDVVCG